MKLEIGDVEIGEIVEKGKKGTDLFFQDENSGRVHISWKIGDGYLFFHLPPFSNYIIAHYQTLCSIV